jgi:hypothetical protein
VLLVNKFYPAKAKDAQDNNGIEVPAKLDVPAQPKKGYLRSRGWRDLIFVGVGLALASWPKIVPNVSDGDVKLLV